MGKKITFLLLLSITFNSVMGAVIGSVAGFSPACSAVVVNAAAVVADFGLPQMGILRAGVLTEVWTGELVKALRSGLEGTWLDGIPDASSIAENDVIHLVDVGIDPDVLVNNTTYPLAIQELPDGDIAISLDKFQTKATPITDDELFAMSYDKMSRVKESHGNALNDKKFAKAAHALCAQSNATKTPVIKTTGEVDPETGRKRMLPANLLTMKAKLDKLKVPAENRRLVLCTDHVNDLLSSDQKFKEQYNINTTDGRVGRLYGFDIYEYGLTPVYTQNGTKKALGATAEAGEFQCSFAFYTKRVFKATGSTKMYFSEAKSDPLNQRNLINFRHYFICMFKKADAGVVIYSDYQAPVAA